jgi:hypothetical protein
MKHPNGYVGIRDVRGDDLPWNVVRCACGALKDFRAGRCRSCYSRIPEQKRCAGCGLVLPIAKFYRRASGKDAGRPLPRCIECLSAATKEKRQLRPEHFAAKRREHRNYKQASDRIMVRMRTEPTFKLAVILRRSVWAALKDCGGRKTVRTVELLGCSIDEFRRHIEAQWRPGMKWENWGNTRDCWQLDHKRPIASFDLRDDPQVRACFHFSNYQPLWMVENASKGARWSAGDAFLFHGNPSRGRARKAA